MTKFNFNSYEFPDEGCNCSTVVIGKNASATGRVIIGHNEDDSRTVIQLHSVPARDAAPGETVTFGDNPHRIKAPAHSLAYMWSEVRKPGGISFGDSFFNECGVVIVTDSCSPGKSVDEETEQSYLGYGLRVLLARQATSARHGVEICKALVEEYGYFGARTYHIADKNECWSVQIPKGHRMAARRIPDDHVYFIPNWFTLHEIDFGDTKHENYVFSDDIASFAEKNGWYKPSVPGDYSDFDFELAYNSDDQSGKGSCRMRSRNAWPVLGFDPGCEKPFSYRAERKYGVSDVKMLLRNHWEGRIDSNNTDYDRNPHQKKSSPYTVCGPCSVESTIAEFADTPAATVVWRAWLQPCTNPYVPFFIGEIRTPEAYHWCDWKTAEETHFSPDEKEFEYNTNSAFWIYKSLTWLTELDYRFCSRFISEAIRDYEYKAEAEVSELAEKYGDSSDESAKAGAKAILSEYSLKKASEADALAMRLIQRIGMAKYKENCYGVPADEAPDYPGDRKNN